MSSEIASVIMKALSKGYTAKSILSYLSNKFPNYANAISTASAAGFAANTILNQLVNRKDKSLNDDEYLTDSEKSDKSDQEKTKKAALGLGASVLGIAGLGAGLSSNLLKNTPQILSSLINTESDSTLIPTENLNANPTQDANIVPQNVAPQTPGQQIGQQIQSPITQALQPSNPTQIAQASQALPQTQPIFEQMLQGVDVTNLSQPQQDQLKFLAMISDQLQSKGKTLKDPEFKNLSSKIKKVIAGTPGMMTQELGRFPKEETNVNPLYITKNEEPTSIIEPKKIENTKSIQKGESVVTEDGNLAEVKGTSGNNFLIEEKGKVRQVPMDSLRSQPEAIKKAKIVFDPSKVPESERSAALAMSLPMPDNSSIINVFPDGSIYLYRRKDGKPIEDSIIKRVIEGQDIPMTTGETFMGAWNQDNGDSRGSAAYKELTSMAQDATKPDDPTKPLVFEKITNSYTHGYLKEFMKLLKETGKNFSAKKEKRKT